jgi:demethylmenaquinone methyltransferase / 2-methoxy-6-polyprenyl-1,4-benzoquinol methylase
MAYQLPPTDQKARYVRTKFDEIARQYDRFNDLITQGQHRWWKHVLVERMNLLPAAMGADVCCGTGDIALRSLKHIRSGGGVVAADFSLNMLRIAKQRLKRRSEDGPARGVLCADAMRLPFRDASLDFVTIGYGLRNVTDLRACLAEILRVLKPGGVMGSLDVGKVRYRWLRPAADFYFFQVVPWIGRRLQPGQDMFTYLPQSSVAYPEQHVLRKMLLDAGFAKAEVIEFVFGASAIHLAWKPT